jgi:hypothetical protein
MLLGTNVYIPLPMLNCPNKKENIIKANSSEETKVEIFLNINFLLFPS